jgi:hypothetical protein
MEKQLTPAPLQCTLSQIPRSAAFFVVEPNSNSACHLLTCWFLLKLFFSTLKMEAIRSSETSVATKQTTRRHIPEYDTLQSQTVTQPPYSPDLTPCDFWLFRGLMMERKGHHFASMEEIQQNTTAGPRAMPGEDFRGSCSNDRTAGASLVVQKGSISRVTWVVFYVPFSLKIMPEFRELFDPPTYF